MRTRTQNIILTTLIFAAILVLSLFAQEFNIEVTIDYLSFQVLTIRGENYFEWDMDTVALDSVVYMHDSLGLHILNLCNGPLVIDASISDDTAGFPVPPDYYPWRPTRVRPFGNYFVMEGVLSELASFPADTSGAITLQITPSTIINSIPTGADRFFYLIFQPPAAPSDFYEHRLKLYLEGRINLY
ncbi:hypothetical protein JXI42_03665 [bacterium]|nr:hypothetical protein [bacterium]